MSQRRAGMQASQMGAQTCSQQLHSSPPQSTTPPLTANQRIPSSCLKIPSILNGFPTATSSTEQEPSDKIPTAERCTKILPQVCHRNLVPKSSSQVTSIEQIASQGTTNAVVTQSGQEPFHPSTACRFGQTSTSKSDSFLKMPPSSSSKVVPLNIRQASRLTDEKRASNKAASARFHQRRKESKNESNYRIEKLQSRVTELERKIQVVERERDLYRDERDQLSGGVLATPIVLQHPATLGSLMPQHAQSAPSQGLIPQIADLQLPPRTDYYANLRSDQAPKRRRKNTQGSYLSAEYLHPIGNARLDWKSDPQA